MPTVRRTLRRLAPLLVIVTACVAPQPLRGARVEPPRLVVVVTVDQMRADYLSRFGGQFRGGLARLLRDGSVFTHAYHDHAIPETAAGHATLLSGRFPRSTGIILNGLGVDDPESPLIDGARGAGASPHRFRGTSLLDWMRGADPRARALSVSGKDRGAILPLGRARGDVYWLAAGRFTTSRYYRDTLPTWVRAYNARQMPARYLGRDWTLLLPDSAYAEPDSVAMEGAGHDFLFPHRAPRDSAYAAGFVARTPWGDEIVLDFALDGVQALGIGTGPQSDLLNVSLSTTDAIGHVYGPDSREMHDQMLRLDRALGVFLDSLFRLRDPAQVVVVLTADHGAAPLPERSAEHERPIPMRVEPSDVLAEVRQGLRARGVDTSAVELALGLVLLDRPALERARLDVDSLLQALAVSARRTPGVLRADFMRDLRAANPARDPIARRWAHQLPTGTPVEMVVTLRPYNIWWSDNVASHHSPHDYDTHVPLVFLGAPFAPGRYADAVRTVDLAPTLAAVLKVKPLEPVDGVVLRQAIRE